MDPSIDYWRDVIEPLGLQLRAEPKFQGIENIQYVRSGNIEVPADQCPAIVYFVDGSWTDRGRGERASSLQVRTGIINIGFGVWYHDQSEGELDRALFKMSGTLFDWLRDHTRFDESKVNILTVLGGLQDYTGGENGLIGSHRITAEFQVLSW